MQKWAVLTALLPLNRAKSQFSMYPSFSVIPSPTVLKYACLPAAGDLQPFREFPGIPL